MDLNLTYKVCFKTEFYHDATQTQAYHYIRRLNLMFSSASNIWRSLEL
jgi:hypothetical protein